MSLLRRRLPLSNRRGAGAWSLLAVVVVSLVWRLPSFFDPPWVNDEGTYFAVAQAMAHGYRLYADVWENKPPAIYLLYRAVYHSFGASLPVVRLLAALAVVALIVLVYRISLAYARPADATAAAMLAGLLMGIPFLEGTTANAEVFAAPMAALGVYLAVVRGEAAAGGITMGLAVLFKVVVGLDAAAAGLWLLWSREARDADRAGPIWWYESGSSRGGIAAFAFYACGLVIMLALALLAAWGAGILQPMLQDALLYDLGYVGHGNGGALPWLLPVKALLLLALTVWLRRTSFPWLWLLYASAGSLVSGRFFGHYAIQAIAPLCVCFALLLGRMGRWQETGTRDRRVWRLTILLPPLFLAGGLLAALVGWGMAVSGHDSILARRLQYYTNIARLALGTESYAQYRGQIDDHVNRNLAIADAVRRTPPGRILVWGNVPWVYVLSDRLGATPYTSALRDPTVPGETAALQRSVVARKPADVIVIQPPAPPLGTAAVSALQRAYVKRATIRNATMYVRR